MSNFRKIARALTVVPPVVVDHLRSFLRVRPDVQPDVAARTLYRHHRAVRACLGDRHATLFHDHTGWSL